MSSVKDFLKRKDIVITPQRYLIEALGAMAQGLFASLLIGTIIKTLGQQTGLEVLVDLGGYASAMSGPAMACAIGWALADAIGIGTTSKSTGQSTRCRPETNQKRMHPLTGSIRFFIEHQIFSASMACCRCW